MEKRNVDDATNHLKMLSSLGYAFKYEISALKMLYGYKNEKE